jgi:hypothetical protein
MCFICQRLVLDHPVPLQTTVNSMYCILLLCDMVWPALCQKLPNLLEHCIDFFQHGASPLCHCDVQSMPQAWSWGGAVTPSLFCGPSAMWLHLQVKVFWVVTLCSVVVGYCFGVQFPAIAGNFSLFHVHIASGAHPASYPMSTGDSFLRGKVTRAWSQPLFPSRAKVKNVWLYTSTTKYVFMAWCLVQHRDTFTFFMVNCLCHYPHWCCFVIG